MMSEKEIIYGVIVSKTNHYYADVDVCGQCRIFVDDAWLRYKSKFLEQVTIYKNRNIFNPFILYVDVYFIREVFDLDNAVKSLCDLLQDCHAIVNDSQCLEIHARKFVDKITPRVEFSIVEKCDYVMHSMG